MQLEAVYLEALLYIIGALNHLTIDTRLTGLTYDADGAPVRHLYDKETFVFFCTRSGYCFIAQGLKVHRKKKKIAQMLLVKDSCSLQMKKTKNLWIPLNSITIHHSAFMIFSQILYWIGGELQT